MPAVLIAIRQGEASPLPSYLDSALIHLPTMIPEILSETLATLRRFDPNGDWHTPDLPAHDDDLEDWSRYLAEVADLAEAARLAMIRLQKAARRGEAF